MKSKDLIDKPEEKGARSTAVGADDLLSKSTDWKTGVPADKKQISPLAAAAVAVALDVHFSSAGVLNR